MASASSVPSWAAPQVPRGTDIVTLLVGLEQDKFVVHKDPLCAASDFFDRAFNGKFAEGASQEIKLEEEDPDIVRCLCDWLYMTPDPDRRWHPSRLQIEWEPDYFWLKVYVMADKLVIPGLQFLACGHLLLTFTDDQPTIPSTHFVTSLYTDTGPEVFQLYIAEHIAYWMPKSVSKDDWSGLLQISDRLAAIFGRTVADKAPEDTPFPHRYLSTCGWLQRHGLDYKGLKKEARKSDKAEEVPMRTLGMGLSSFHA